MPQLGLARNLQSSGSLEPENSSSNSSLPNIYTVPSQIVPKRPDIVHCSADIEHTNHSSLPIKHGCRLISPYLKERKKNHTLLGKNFRDAMAWFGHKRNKYVCTNYVYIFIKVLFSSQFADYQINAMVFCFDLIWVFLDLIL